VKTLLIAFQLIMTPVPRTLEDAQNLPALQKQLEQQQRQRREYYLGLARACEKEKLEALAKLMEERYKHLYDGGTTVNYWKKLNGAMKALKSCEGFERAAQ
jgi:hypothetical protein